MENQQNTFSFCLPWKDKIVPSGAAISTSRSHFTNFPTFHMEDLYGCFTKLVQVKIFSFTWMQPNHFKYLLDHSVGLYQDLTWVRKYNILGNMYSDELGKNKNKTKPNRFANQFRLVHPGRCQSKNCTGDRAVGQTSCRGRHFVPAEHLWEGKDGAGGSCRLVRGIALII